MRPLYVRLPDEAADKLARAAVELRTPKQNLVAHLVENHLTVGKHDFFPNAVEDVLTAEEAAELLRTDAATVIAMAENGTLPGRKLGDDWRFARAALLRWLAENHFTLLGHAEVDSNGQVRNALGILRVNVSLGIRTALDTLHDLRFWPAVDAWIQRRHGLIRQHVPAGADGGETWQ